MNIFQPEVKCIATSICHVKLISQLFLLCCYFTSYTQVQNLSFWIITDIFSTLKIFTFFSNCELNFSVHRLFPSYQKEKSILIGTNWWPQHRRDLHACLDSFPWDMLHSGIMRRERHDMLLWLLVLPERTFILGTWSCTLPRGYILHIFHQPTKEERGKQHSCKLSSDKN